MALNEKTKYRLANKWINGAFDKNAYDFENKGKIGVGRMSWSTPVRKGDKTEFENSTIKFVCFKDNISFVENNLSGRFNIEGNLVQKRNDRATGDQPKTYFELNVFKIELAEEQPNAHQKAKANGYQVETTPALDDWQDSEIPF